MLRLPSVLAMVPLLSAPGCCSLARLFCGPDRSAWVQVDFETPAQAVRTFLEALRRDNVDRVCESLSLSYKRAHGIDNVAAKVVWDKLREDAPYLYMAGYAKVPDQPTRQQPDRAVFDLEIDGYALHVELVRQPYWLVKYLRPGDDTVHERSIPVESLGPYLRLPTAEEQPEPYDAGYVPVRFRPATDWRTAPHFPLDQSLDEASLDHVVRVEFGQEWKISGLRTPRPE